MLASSCKQGKALFVVQVSRMSGSSGMETTTSSQPLREGRGSREKSHDMLAALEERLARLEATMSEHREKYEDMDFAFLSSSPRGTWIS